MRTLALALTVCLSPMSHAAEPEFQIDAIVSLESIQEVLRQVRETESRPILSITQAKKGKKDGQTPAVGEFYTPNDVDSLIVDTGVVHNPENGHGKRYYFRRVKGRWFMTKSESWVA